MRELTAVEKQWIFEVEALNRTPSSLDGISPDEELRRRRQTILNIRSLILRVNSEILMKDPSQWRARGVMTIAATLVHRFYMRRSFKDFSEEIMAGTILFLASKIEEEPLKLRYICNHCLAKFDHNEGGQWNPQGDHGPPASHAYLKWEKEILATEEVVLETLCFDMGVEQPWTILRRCIRGMDKLSRTSPYRIEHEVDEAIVAELAWTLLNEAHLSPLPILYPGLILAFTALILVLALVERLPTPQAIVLASELGGRFDLDINWTESDEITGSDVATVESCLYQFIRYCRTGLIDPGLLAYFPEEPSEPSVSPRIRRWLVDGKETRKGIEKPNANAQKDQPADTAPQAKSPMPQPPMASAPLPPPA